MWSNQSHYKRIDWKGKTIIGTKSCPTHPHPPTPPLKYLMVCPYVVNATVQMIYMNDYKTYLKSGYVAHLAALRISDDGIMQ